MLHLLYSCAWYLLHKYHKNLVILHIELTSLNKSSSEALPTDGTGPRNNHKLIKKSNILISEYSSEMVVHY